MADAVSVSDLDHLWDPKAEPLFTSKPPEWVATYLPRYCQSVSDRADSDCRGLALAVRELNRDGFWQRLFPDWETCCLALFKRPAAWVEQVVEGVRVLHAHGHDGAVPLQLAITQAKAQPLAENRRTNQHQSRVLQCQTLALLPLRATPSPTYSAELPAISRSCWIRSAPTRSSAPFAPLPSRQASSNRCRQCG
jgi:hypothetical protein